MKMASSNSSNYVIRVDQSPAELDVRQWNDLLMRQAMPTPFMRHEYLLAMQQSGSAVAKTGWRAAFISVHSGDQLVAACPMYLKDHSYGEYVFDWAWANAHHQHGLPYYPKTLIAVPFTPVPGSRLLAIDSAARDLLLKTAIDQCRAHNASSLHLLFGDEADLEACHKADLLSRQTVQFHWGNVAPTLVAARTALPPEGAHFSSGAALQKNLAPTLVAARTAADLKPDVAVANRFSSFEEFLGSLTQDKRKKIRQERRKVADAGVTFRWAQGRDITPSDWDFFYACYARTYLEHGNAPYLSRSFFSMMQKSMPENWLLFVAMRNKQAIATSLIAIGAYSICSSSTFDSQTVEILQSPSMPNPPTALTAYGRYWGALERVDCLHFEACYYQPLQWCIDHGVLRFEGGAQGEHKMARALLPVQTQSAHWLAHPAFARAIETFLEREQGGVSNYLEDLHKRNPYKQATFPRD